MELALALNTWFLENKRDLPWRTVSKKTNITTQSDPYPIWISEVMLQQTTVKAVIPFFEKFISRFPTVDDLAKASLEEVYQYWAGLGYYSRARNLHKSAQILAVNGFPEQANELIKLPGFGPYTSRAVSSISFNEAVGVLDGNVIRVLTRIENLKIPWWNQENKDSLQNLSDQLVKLGLPSILNQALMELGATICTPDKPLCLMCPIKKHCKGLKNNPDHEWHLTIPMKKPKKQKRLWVFTPFIQIKKNKIMLQNDSSFPFLKNTWFIPGELKEVGAPPKKFLIKHSITNNYIFIKSLKKTDDYHTTVNKKTLLWANFGEVKKHSPSSLTQKILKLSGL